MTGYLFDTDTISAPLRRRPNLIILHRLNALPRSTRFTSPITLGELLFGASRMRRTDLIPRIEDLVSQLAQVLPFDEQAA